MGNNCNYSYADTRELFSSGINNVQVLFLNGIGKIGNPGLSFKLKTKQKVIKRGSDVYITFKYKHNYDMHLVIGKCGINNMVNIKEIYINENDSPDISTSVKNNASTFVSPRTDWIGPYNIKSLVHDDGTKWIFTGGFHGSNDNASGHSTGKTGNISVKVDGQKIRDNIEYVGNVEIIADNYIKAYNNINSDMFVLNEVVKYRVSPGKINVEVVSTALEDALVVLYYGMQSDNRFWNGKIVYGNGITSVNGKYSDTGAFNKKNIVDNYTVYSKNGLHKLCVKIDKAYGLGKFENINENKPTIFTESYGKTYFNLINGKSIRLCKDDQIKWRGSYEFK
jgi:hypothetical protein